MDRDTMLRTIAAVVISILILVGWQYFFPGAKPRPPEPRPEAESPLPATGPAAAEGGGTAAAAAGPTAPAPAPTGEVVAGAEGQPLVEITSPRHEIALTARGAKVVSWKLLDYERVPGDPSRGYIDLVSSESRSLDRNPLTIDPHDPALFKTINEAWYVVDRTPPTAAELAEKKLPEGTERVRFRWADGNGLAVEKSLWIPGDHQFRAWVEWSLTKDGRPVPDAAITWGPGIGAPTDPENANQYAYRGLAVVQIAGETKTFSPVKQEGDIVWPAGTGPRWVALDEQYFSVAIVPKVPATTELRLFDFPGAPKGETRQILLGTASPELMLFAGPKSSPVLDEVDRELGTDLSSLIQWGFWGWLARPLYLAMEWVFSLVGNWGWTIVILSVLIRVAFFPLMHRSMVKMRRTQQDMARIQPKIHKVKEKYKEKRDAESRRKMNEEMMQVYRDEGVNPMASLSGCLPMLLQIPVMFAMYSVLTVSVQLRGAPWFGWIHDLTARDPYYVLPIVMGATQLLQQIMTMTKTEDPQQRAQQRMMLIMPVMFTWFFIYMPAGLVLYWLISNIMGIVQQYFINRHANAAPSTPAAAGARAR